MKRIVPYLGSLAAVLGAGLWSLFWTWETNETLGIGLFDYNPRPDEVLPLLLYTLMLPLSVVLLALSMVALVDRHEAGGRRMLGWGKPITLLSWIVIGWVAAAMLLRTLAVYDVMDEHWGPWLTFRTGLTLLGVTTIVAGAGCTEANLFRYLRFAPFATGVLLLLMMDFGQYVPVLREDDLFGFQGFWLYVLPVSWVPWAFMNWPSRVSANPTHAAPVSHATHVTPSRSPHGARSVTVRTNLPPE